MSNIEKIRQEIERRKKELTPHKGQGVILCREIIKQFDSLLSFIDTISQPIKKDDIIDEICSEIERRFSEYNHDSNHHIQAAECASILTFIDSLPEETCKESLQVQETCKEKQDSFTDKPKEMSVGEAMKYIDEKIAKARESKSWEGVDVDKFLDEVRGREPDDLEEAAEDSWALYEYRETPQGLYSSCYRDGFIAGAKWMESQMPMPEDTVIFMKGVAEGRRLEREDRNDDNLPKFYGD